MRHAALKGSGSYKPDNIVHNRTFEFLVDTSDEWIRSRTGIEKRPVTIDENTSDLAFEASIRALRDASMQAEDIDLIIVATVTGDYFFPGVSQLLQRRLGCGNITAFDINAACTGFIYALEIADQMIKGGRFDTALIVGAEVLTKFTDFSDRNTCVLFGDAAGAMVLTASKAPGIITTSTHARGDLEGYLHMESYPLKKDFQTIEDSRPFINMNGREIFRFATTVIPEVVEELLGHEGMNLDALDMIVAHQANKRIIDKASKALAFPKEKMYLNIESTGNTSAASVPLAIDEAIKDDRLQSGDTFAAVAFGAGLTWGGALITLGGLS